MRPVLSKCNRGEAGSHHSMEGHHLGRLDWNPPECWGWASPPKPHSFLLPSPCPMYWARLPYPKVFFLSLIKKRGSKALAFTAIISKMDFKNPVWKSGAEHRFFLCCNRPSLPCEMAPLSERQRKVTDEGKRKTAQCPFKISYDPLNQMCLLLWSLLESTTKITAFSDVLL